MYWYLKDTVADLVLYYHLVAPFTSVFLFRSGHLLKCTESGHLLLKCPNRDILVIKCQFHY